MSIRQKNYFIPLVVGILADKGVNLKDGILKKFIASNLLKIRNTFPNSPFIMLYDEECMDDSLLFLFKSGLGAEEMPVKVDESDGEDTTEMKIASFSQILFVLHDGAQSDSVQNIQSAIEYKLLGHQADRVQSVKPEPGLDAPDFGLLIYISPKSYRMETRITPELAGSLDDAVDNEREPRIADRISGAAGSLVSGLMVKLNTELSNIYDRYVRFPEEKNGNVLKESEFLEIAEKIEFFNRDVSKYLGKGGEQDFLQSQGYLLQDEINNESIVGNEGLMSIVSVYSSADVLSQYHQKRTNRVINLIYIFFFVAVLLYGIIDYSYYLVLFYIALIPAIALLVYKSSVDQVEDRFLDYRALAEGLRVLFFWRYYGISEKVSDNYLSKYAGLVSWISRAVRNVETELELNGVEEAGDRENALVVIEKLWIKSQLDYYSRKRVPLFARSQQFGSVVFVSFVLTLAVAVVFGVYIIFQGVDNNFATTWFEVVLGAIAAVGVAAQAYKNKRAYDQLERRYNLTRQIYSAAQEKLVNGSYSPEQILKFVGKEALIENSDWLWTHRNLPLEVPKG